MDLDEKPSENSPRVSFFPPSIGEGDGSFAEESNIEAPARPPFPGEGLWSNPGMEMLENSGLFGQPIPDNSGDSFWPPPFMGSANLFAEGDSGARRFPTSRNPELGQTPPARLPPYQSDDSISFFNYSSTVPTRSINDTTTVALMPVSRKQTAQNQNPNGTHITPVSAPTMGHASWSSATSFPRLRTDHHNYSSRYGDMVTGNSSDLFTANNGRSLSTNQVIVLSTVIPGVVVLVMALLLLWLFVFRKKKRNVRVGVEMQQNGSRRINPNSAPESDEVARANSVASKYSNDARDADTTANGDRRQAWTDNEGAVEIT